MDFFIDFVTKNIPIHEIDTENNLFLPENSKSLLRENPELFSILFSIIFSAESLYQMSQFSVLCPSYTENKNTELIDDSVRFQQNTFKSSNVTESQLDIKSLMLPTHKYLITFQYYKILESLLSVSSIDPTISQDLQIFLILRIALSSFYCDFFESFSIYFSESRDFEEAHLDPILNTKRNNSPILPFGTLLSNLQNRFTTVSKLFPFSKSIFSPWVQICRHEILLIISLLNLQLSLSNPHFGKAVISSHLARQNFTRFSIDIHPPPIRYTSPPPTPLFLTMNNVIGNVDPQAQFSASEKLPSKYSLPSDIWPSTARITSLAHWYTNNLLPMMNIVFYNSLHKYLCDHEYSIRVPRTNPQPKNKDHNFDSVIQSQMAKRRKSFFGYLPFSYLPAFAQFVESTDCCSVLLVEYTSTSQNHNNQTPSSNTSPSSPSSYHGSRHGFTKTVYSKTSFQKIPESQTQPQPQTEGLSFSNRSYSSGINKPDSNYSQQNQNAQSDIFEPSLADLETCLFSDWKDPSNPSNPSKQQRYSYLGDPRNKSLETKVLFSYPASFVRFFNKSLDISSNKHSESKHPRLNHFVNEIFTNESAWSEKSHFTFPLGHGEMYGTNKFRFRDKTLFEAYFLSYSQYCIYLVPVSPVLWVVTLHPIPSAVPNLSTHFKAAQKQKALDGVRQMIKDLSRARARFFSEFYSSPSEIAQGIIPHPLVSGHAKHISVYAIPPRNHDSTGTPSHLSQKGNNQLLISPSQISQGKLVSRWKSLTFSKPDTGDPDLNINLRFQMTFPELITPFNQPIQDLWDHSLYKITLEYRDELMKKMTLESRKRLFFVLTNRFRKSMHDPQIDLVCSILKLSLKSDEIQAPRYFRDDNFQHPHSALRSPGATNVIEPGIPDKVHRKIVHPLPRSSSGTFLGSSSSSGASGASAVGKHSHTSSNSPLIGPTQQPKNTKGDGNATKSPLSISYEDLQLANRSKFSPLVRSKSFIKNQIKPNPLETVALPGIHKISPNINMKTKNKNSLKSTGVIYNLANINPLAPSGIHPQFGSYHQTSQLYSPSEIHESRSPMSQHIISFSDESFSSGSLNTSIHFPITHNHHLPDLINPDILKSLSQLMSIFFSRHSLGYFKALSTYPTLGGSSAIPSRSISPSKIDNILSESGFPPDNASFQQFQFSTLGGTPSFPSSEVPSTITSKEPDGDSLDTLLSTVQKVSKSIGLPKRFESIPDNQFQDEPIPLGEPVKPLQPQSYLPMLRYLKLLQQSSFESPFSLPVIPHRLSNKDLWYLHTNIHGVWKILSPLPPRYWDGDGWYSQQTHKIMCFPKNVEPLRWCGLIVQ